MRILGIDPGFERLGIAVLEKSSQNKKSFNKVKNSEKIIFSECFRTQAELAFSERLHLLGEKVKKTIKKYKPEVLAIETLFINTNQKTAMRVAEARGVIIYEAQKANLQIIEISPLQIKMSLTGYGRADKNQINKMVKLLVPMDYKKRFDDELDAIAITLVCFSLLSNIKLKS